MNIKTFAITTVFISCLTAMTQSKAADTASAGGKFGTRWQTLVGEWKGDNSGQPGSGIGVCSFKFDLQNQILVRRARAEFPASNGRPASVHEDLMVIHPGSEGGPASAIYFDSEGHVIEYSAVWSSAGDVLTFTSKPAPGAPQFRLVYKVIDPRTFSVSFDIAPPNQPGAFKTHVAGRMQRSK